MPRKKEPGKHAYEGLDRALHEKARLAILTSLLTHSEGLRFAELKELCSLTDGNLSRHLQILKQESLIEIWKGFEKNRPQTLCRLTPRGRERFLAYLEQLESILKEAAESAASTRAERRGTIPSGWVRA